MNKPQFDIILFGATSFVGRIIARHIQDLINQRNASLPNNFSWAIAARDDSRLRELRVGLGEAAQALPLIIAEANNDQQLRQLCAQARVIISTVGPYAFYGETLVKVCAETGTDYCDLTGEVQWIKKMIERYESSAKRSGARIVHCCGFDSVPSDLGVFHLQQRAAEIYQQRCKQIKMGVKVMKGGFSGGTVASLINVAREAVADKELRRQLANPYLLCPENHHFATRQDPDKSDFDPDFNSWTAPFIMSGINTRIVHRSNALLGTQYGENFRYSETMLMGKKGKWRSKMTSWGLGLFTAAIALAPTRWLLQRFVLPKPGEGPSEKQQRDGCYTLLFIGITENGNTIQTEVHGDRDPGYGSTAKILTQAGLCLARDIDKQQKPGGFWTPATVLGNLLIDRLSHYAGVSFTVVTDQADSGNTF